MTPAPRRPVGPSITPRDKPRADLFHEPMQHLEGQPDGWATIADYEAYEQAYEMSRDTGDLYGRGEDL